VTGVYVDSSALVKLVIEEPESTALRAYLLGRGPIYASRIAAIELRRAVLRQARTDPVDQAESVLEAMRFIELDEPMTRLAGTAGPPSLRTLDAIHLSAALAIGEECGAFVSYDARLNAAAEAAGLSVHAPH